MPEAALSQPSKRVIVFLDYQNVYMRAREAFYPTPLPGHKLPAVEGQVDPLKLADLIVRRATHEARHLHQVRVYRGQPDATRQPKAYGAALKQVASWQRDPLVQTMLRPIRYPLNWPAQKAEEKGIDVKLAVDFISMAIRRDYDIGIIMSEDTDLVPALEAVISLRATTHVHCEVAAWRPLTGPRRGLKLGGGGKLWCHYLTQADYQAAADPTDYTR